MNLTSEEKIQIVHAYDNGDYETLFALFSKAKGSCGVCKSFNYVQTWMEYWLNTSALIRPDK